jgi:hypothetical protein
MNVLVFYSLLLLFGGGACVAAIALVLRRGWLRPLLSDHELLMVGKLLFVIGAVMFLVVLRNSIDLPAGQFIYGRF